MREAWTDERLDDLTVRMDRGFDRVDRDLRELRVEMDAQFDRLEGKMERLEAKMDKRFDSMWRMTLAAYLTIVGLIVTQL